jgi:AraC-like DNA-binding protein
VGFSSPSYFSRVFFRCTGESPSDFRSQHEEA